ncbi:MAG: lipopolysaccharide transport periplasmic protein LptA [Thermodesulfobacteriota bacterium]
MRTRGLFTVEGAVEGRAAVAAGTLFFFIISILWAVFLFPTDSRGEASGLEKGTPITITSDTMEASRKDHLVTFKGNVSAREEFLLCSDELYLRYSEGSEIKEIEARGGVRIYRKDNTSRAETAVYDRASRIIVLKGNAEVERCADTVKGSKITLYLDTDKAFVEGMEKGRVKAVIIPGKKCVGPAVGAADTERGKTPEKGRGEREALCTGTR